MRAASPGVEDLDSPLAVVHHHDPPRLGTQSQPGGVDQGPPAAEGHLLRTSRLPPGTQQSAL
ncbi:hypothetical protein K5549_004039 [Capra hircus]|uniref:Uncharacterized protein n=1 Tax=Capra hircus TaxID=9925 RepID=A0A452F599_CAPHI|nr:hypothetical protein K5549_004039 [Capra hircus]